MDSHNKSSSSFTIGISLVVAFIQIAIAIFTNLLSSGFQTYLPVSQLGFIIFAVLSIAFLVIAGVVLQYLAPNSISPPERGYTPIIHNLGNVAFWLGIMTTIGIMAYFVWSGTYPKQIDLQSVACWGLSCIWFVSLFPMYIGAEFQASIKVPEGWQEKKSKIAKHLVARKMLMEDDIQLLIANTGIFGFMEARKTMARFAKEEKWAILDKIGGDYILKIDTIQ